MIRKIDHLVITTAQCPACIAFYEALGFVAQNVGERWELFAGDFKINVHIEGHELLPKAAHVQPGSADLCFEVEGSLEDLRSRLREAGLIFAEDLCIRNGVCGMMHSIYLRDPDGNLIELSSYADA